MSRQLRSRGRKCFQGGGNLPEKGSWQADRSDAGRESMPTDQNDDSDIPPQTVKVKSASFYSARDSAETGGTTATSAGTLNADDNETPNMFMAANQLERIAGGEEGSHFQPTELESAESGCKLCPGKSYGKGIAGESNLRKNSGPKASHFIQKC